MPSWVIKMSDACWARLSSQERIAFAEKMTAAQQAVSNMEARIHAVRDPSRPRTASERKAGSGPSGPSPWSRQKPPDPQPEPPDQAHTQVYYEYEPKQQREQRVIAFRAVIEELKRQGKW
jgi:hypothetical protein